MRIEDIKNFRIEENQKVGGFWFSVIRHPLSVIFFVSLVTFHSSLFTSCASAQVEVETELISVESESELEKQLQAHKGVSPDELEADSKQPGQVSKDAISVEAQTGVEQPGQVSKDAISIESEIKTEDVMRAREAAPKVATGFKKTEEGEVVPQDLTLQEDREILGEELLLVQQEAVRADVIGEQEVAQINKSLRRAIEQNRRLQEEKKKMQEELGKLRGESRLEENRRKALTNQVELYEKRIEQVVEVQKTFEETINELQTQTQNREQSLVARIKELQTQLEDGVKQQEQGDAIGGADQLSVEEAIDVDSGNGIVKSPKAALDVVRLIDDLDVMRQTMKEDEARVHYNMGNIFFHQGKHQEAVAEYQKAVEITPEDAAAHFNLAFVSGDHLNDFKTAIKHYNIYLFLNPTAKDGPLVKEKILEAQLFLRSWADKSVDHETERSRARGIYTW